MLTTFWFQINYFTCLNYMLRVCRPLEKYAQNNRLRQDYQSDVKFEDTKVKLIQFQFQ